MDLHINHEKPTPEERAAVDGVLGPAPESSDRHADSGKLSAGAERHRLLPVLHAVQSRCGWISSTALHYICSRLGVPPAEAYGVVSFYGLFSLAPRPSRVVHVCDDIACLVRGSGKLCEALELSLGPAGSSTEDGAATWVRSACLGLCERAPAALLSVAGESPHQLGLAPVTVDTVTGFLGGKSAANLQQGHSGARLSAPQAGVPGLKLLRRVGRIDPGSLDDYRTHGGYSALRRAFELGPEGVIREVIESKLMGRGGAAFPTGKKWASARPAHYLVCNADESEPGTFKDRVLMEWDPFAIIEAMTIAGFATGCREGYLYIRGEYPLACRRLAHAIGAARNRGYLGSNILGQGMRFDIELRRGAGAYICGEETALFNSIEGFRGEPRSKPPFPTQSGLFGKPTVVNNVETLVNVQEIVMETGRRYASIGTEGSTGTKLFCLSGHSVRPGVYEVPFGTTLRGLIDLAGGVSGSGKLQAVLLGGAAGSFLAPAELDTPLTFEGTRALGAAIGSGVLMLFDDTVDLKRILLRIASFFSDETCGQCVPCRVGTVRQEELLSRLVERHPLGSIKKELTLLGEVGQVMRDASICGLGQTASSAVESALGRWRLFE